MRILVRLAINAAAFWVTATVLPNLEIDGGARNLVLVALVFGLVNTFIRPVARLLTLPLRAMTLGLFTLVVNGLMVVITTWIVGVLSLEGGFVSQTLTAIAAAAIISVVSAVLGWIVPDSHDNRAVR